MKSAWRYEISRGSALNYDESVSQTSEAGRMVLDPSCREFQTAISWLTLAMGCGRKPRLEIIAFYEYYSEQWRILWHNAAFQWKAYITSRHKSHSRQDGEKVARNERKQIARVSRRHAFHSQDGRREWERKWRESRLLFMSTFGHEETPSFPESFPSSSSDDYSRKTPSQIIAAFKSSENSLNSLV